MRLPNALGHIVNAARWALISASYAASEVGKVSARTSRPSGNALSRRLRWSAYPILMIPASSHETT